MQTPDEAGSAPAPDRVKSPWPESQTGSGGECLTSNERIRVRAGKEKEEARSGKGFEHFGHPQNVDCSFYAERRRLCVVFPPLTTPARRKRSLTIPRIARVLSRSPGFCRLKLQNSGPFFLCPRSTSQERSASSAAAGSTTKSSASARPLYGFTETPLLDWGMASRLRVSRPTPSDE